MPPLMTFFEVRLYFGLDPYELHALIEQGRLRFKVIPLGGDDYDFRITGESVEEFEAWLASFSDAAPPV